MEALRCLRESVETVLAAKRGKSRGKNRAVREEIRIPSEILQQRAVRDFRQRTGDPT